MNGPCRSAGHALARQSDALLRVADLGSIGADLVVVGHEAIDLALQLLDRCGPRLPRRNLFGV